MRRLVAPLLTAAALSLSGCDWVFYNFVNSIPFHGDPANNPLVHVYIGVDGVSLRAAQEAIRRGAFSGTQMQLSRFITGFPGTSDYSWTRTLRAGKMQGYEMSYYDPVQDKVQNKGLIGVAKHAVPAFSDKLSFEAPYLRGFDFHSNGYTHAVGAYRDTFVSISDTLDNIFFLLDGRSQTNAVFAAYVLETDVMGHMHSLEDTVQTLIRLSGRIERFKQNHPEREFRFTLLSDHGMDFIPVSGDRLVTFSEEMKRVGVSPVERLRDHDPEKELFAIPIEHVRVTYIALHTHRSLTERVAERVSRIPSVDLAVSRLAKPPRQPDIPTPLEWYGLYSDGELAAYFGFDRDTDRYYVPAKSNFERFGFQLSCEGEKDFSIFTDDELFRVTRFAKYPDLLYRVRTGLSPVAVSHPAEVLVSFRPGWAEMGFKVPLGGNDIASSGFHGALEERGSTGILLSEERPLPEAVRSDTFLELFPRMREHLRSQGVEYVEGDPNRSLEY